MRICDCIGRALGVLALCALMFPAGVCLPDAAAAETDAAEKEQAADTGAAQAETQSAPADDLGQSQAQDQVQLDQSQPEAPAFARQADNEKAQAGAGSSQKDTTGKKTDKTDAGAKSAKSAKSRDDDECAGAVKSALEKADELGGKAHSALDDVRVLQARLDAAVASYDTARKKAKRLSRTLEKLEARSTDIEAEKQRAQAVIDAVAVEKRQSAPADITDVLAGKASFDEIDSKDYLLDKVAADRARALAAYDEELALTVAKAKRVKRKAAKARKEAKERLHAANAAALSVEKAAGEALWLAQQAQAVLADVKKAKLSAASKAALADGQRDAKKRRETCARTCDAAMKNTAAWYDRLDKLGHVKHAVTFGTGAEFALGKDAFVGKWGSAIDAFFAAYGKKAGAHVPLYGTGKTMAASAFEHKIDPRLCAAVSIIESGGGASCIKSCNAWGWGAADSDPYGGAAAWNSWDSAIEEWHAGVDDSTTGLATAGTLCKFGSIYCSTASWCGKVAVQMEEISKLAE